MLLLQKLTLLNFKNYEEVTFTFSSQLNCIVGENGVGKTNLLDAIHFLCLTKSAFSHIDTQHIRYENPFFMLQGWFEKENKSYQIDCSVQKEKGKILKINKKEYDKLAEHIGQFPCILMMPYDTDLIREGSELRRKFFDNVISQIDKIYLQDLMKYNHLLKQRNALLTQFAEGNYIDKDLLQSYDVPLMLLNIELCQKRKDFLKDFVPLLQQYYHFLSEGKEVISLEYETNVSLTDFSSAFQTCFAKDLAAQRTTLGIHKDDYAFKFNDLAVAKFGSQGQQKTYVIALRLAQAAVIEQLTGQKPLLLLDDIFDKLDENRIRKLLAKIDDGEFGQVFITDARPERTQSLLQALRREVKMISL